MVFFERWHPLLIAIGAWVFAIYAQADLFAALRESAKDVGSLYSAIFDLASIIAAFMFGFLTFIKTTENKFLTAFRKNAEYDSAVKYMRNCVIYSACLTVGTIPLIVWQPAPEQVTSLMFWVVSLWFALVAFTLAGTARSAYHFIAILDAAYGKIFKERAVA